jgi:hypothetical protein
VRHQVQRRKLPPAMLMAGKKSAGRFGERSPCQPLPEAGEWFTSASVGLPPRTGKWRRWPPAPPPRFAARRHQLPRPKRQRRELLLRHSLVQRPGRLRLRRSTAMAVSRAWLPEMQGAAGPPPWGPGCSGAGSPPINAKLRHLPSLSSRQRGLSRLKPPCPSTTRNHCRLSLSRCRGSWPAPSRLPSSQRASSSLSSQCHAPQSSTTRPIAFPCSCCGTLCQTPCA